MCKRWDTPKVTRLTKHDVLCRGHGVGLGSLVLEVDQDDQGRLRSKGVRQGRGEGLDTGTAGVERERLLDPHARDADSRVCFEVRRRVCSEVQRKPPARGLEKVDVATANLAVLVQDF